MHQRLPCLSLSLFLLIPSLPLSQFIHISSISLPASPLLSSLFLSLKVLTCALIDNRVESFLTFIIRPDDPSLTGTNSLSLSSHCTLSSTSSEFTVSLEASHASYFVETGLYCNALLSTMYSTTLPYSTLLYSV